MAKILNKEQVEYLYDDTRGRIYNLDNKKLNKQDLPVVDSALSSTSENAVQNKAIYTALAGKAESSHTHAISDVTDLQSTLNEKSNTGHTHTKSNITDFPSSMPASDVYSWAKASSKPTYTASEVGTYDTGEIDALLDGKSNIGHTHGGITNAGAIGTAANKLISTTTNGVLTAATTLEATSLAAGSTPTVSLSNGTLTFGIPKGASGSNGAAAGFGTPTATVDANVGTPSVTITASGANTAKVFNFAFKNLKGATGATGPNFTVTAGSGNQYILGVSSQTGNINTSKSSGAYFNGSNLYATGFNISSLRKWKENIKPTEVKALDLINSQNIVDFNYKDDELKSHKIGLIADDSDTLFLAPTGDAVDLYNTCGILLKAVQELSIRVKELEDKLNKH